MKRKRNKVMKGFLSDNSSSVHPLILESLVKANDGHVYPYGGDPYTLELVGLFEELMGCKTYVTLVMNGTGANVCGLAAYMDRYSSVLAVDTAHINVDECGALESYTSGKIVTVPHKNGKLDVELLDEHLKVKGNFHHNQPSIISISQVTEFGSVYTLEELKAITTYAHKNQLIVHMDGARISNALVSLGCSVREMLVETGIDIISFGGTKNGMMYGEAIICFDEAVHETLGYIRKQSMQLASKMRYISCQFLEFLKNDLYLKNATHANEMCQLMKAQLEQIKGVDFVADVDANIIFATLPPTILSELERLEHFYVMDDKIGLVRLVTSYDTEPSEVEHFCDLIKGLVDTDKKS